MPYDIGDDRITDVRTFENGTPEKTQIRLLLRELRRERTGMHGVVYVVENGKFLGHDSFNVSRSEERRKLVKATYPLISRLVQEMLEIEALQHWLDAVCRYAATDWETDRHKVVIATGKAGQRVMLLSPHVEQGTGTIIFAPGGAGKSWLLLMMAMSLNHGVNTVWGSGPVRPALYVDMERHQVFFESRQHEVEAALGLEQTRLPYLKARGLGFANLRKILKGWSDDNLGGVILYDSISRTGMGSLNEDDTANSIIDLANSCSETWVALAHSPRGDATHAFGSVHFDNGADTVIRLVSKEKDGVLGCSLKVTKSNHMGHVLPTYYSLEFGGGGLSKIRQSSAGDWPDLADDKDQPPGDLVTAMLQTVDATVDEIVKATGLSPATVARIITTDHRFEDKGKAGRAVVWGLKRNPRGLPA